jgi:hypothetical protein
VVGNGGDVRVFGMKGSAYDCFPRRDTGVGRFAMLPRYSSSPPKNGVVP